MKPKTVLIYGDSITAAAYLSESQQHRRWTTQIETQSNGMLCTINEGKGGRSTDSQVEFEAVLQHYKSLDLLVIALGANDARDISGNCVPNAENQIRWMIRRAREVHGISLAILIVGPTNIRQDALGPTRSIGDERTSNLRALNLMQARLAAEEQCAFLSLYNVLSLETLASDGVHPDVAGHDQITKAIQPAILSAVGIATPLLRSTQTESCMELTSVKEIRIE